MKNKKVFVSWSGGKDSALSLYLAKKRKADVCFLLNMMNSTGRVSRSHGITPYLMKKQAEALGISLIQKRTSWNRYEENFKKVLSNLKKNGVEGGIFGDIDTQEHRDWVERVCRESGLDAHLPIWNSPREKLMKELIRTGFRAVIVVVNSDYLGEEWLGRELDNDFLKSIKKCENVDICGEKGEFHTFVYDGPVFNKPVEFAFGKKVVWNQYRFLELKEKV